MYSKCKLELVDYGWKEIVNGNDFQTLVFIFSIVDKNHKIEVELDLCGSSFKKYFNVGFSHVTTKGYPNKIILTCFYSLKEMLQNQNIQINLDRGRNAYSICEGKFLNKHNFGIIENIADHMDENIDLTGEVINVNFKK